MRLIVSLHGVDAAELFREEGSGHLCFRYLAGYVEMNGLPISHSLPLSDEIVKETYGKLHPYFSNLMPEGWTKQIAIDYNLGFNDDLFALLKLNNPIGAIAFRKGDSSALTKTDNSSLIVLAEQVLAHPPHILHCLACGKGLISPGYNQGLHDPCSKKFFGTQKAPSLELDWGSIRGKVRKQLECGVVLTGVHPKFSAVMKTQRNTLTTKVQSAHYIVKPEPKDEYFKDMTRLEASVSQFAAHLKLRICDNLLYFLSDGSPVCIIKRFDLIGSGDLFHKLHMEDSAQALGVHPESKYRKGSHEKIGKIIRDKTMLPENAVKQLLSEYFRITLFNFITANADAHLKNHSFFHLRKTDVEIMGIDHPLLWPIKKHLKLGLDDFFKDRTHITIPTPWYDIFPARIFPSGDEDDLGLSVCGKTRNLTKPHFVELANYLGIGKQQAGRIFNSIVRGFEKGAQTLDNILTRNDVSKVKQDLLRNYIDQKLDILR